MRRVATSPEVGVEPVVYLACSRMLEGQTGLYLHRMTRKEPDPTATDPVSGERLWDATTCLLAECGFPA